MYMRDERWIDDGGQFGQILRTLRVARGLSQAELAQAMANVHPDLTNELDWVNWVEAGLIPTIDDEHVTAAAGAFELPVSRLLPISPPVDEHQKTVREQMQKWGLSETDIAAIAKVMDVASSGTGIACSPSRTLAEQHDFGFLDDDDIARWDSEEL